MLALLQFDSPSIAVLESMISAGKLPVLASFRTSRPFGPLDASPSLYEAAVYPTLYTGVDVGDHALYSAFPWAPEMQRVQAWQEVPKPATVWERLAVSGRRSLVVDPYQGWVGTGESGLWLSGWQFRNRMVLPRWSSPPDALATLGRELGPPPTAETTFGRPHVGALLGMRRALLEAPKRAATLVTSTLAREHFDLLWVTFSGVHLAGHYLWDRSLILESDLEEEGRCELDTALVDVYAAADAALGRILEALPADTDVVIFSPDGMGPNTSRSDLLPAMLAAVLGDAPHAAATTGGALWRWRAMIPAPWRAAAARMMPDDADRRLTAALHTWGADWRRTRAFALPGDCHGFVRLNLRGRERDGVVAEGDAAALLDEIAAGLMTFHDTDGAPSIAAVERIPTSVAGKRRADLFPDLVVRWGERPTAKLQRVVSPVFGEVRRNGAGPGLPGNHAEGAWIIVAPRRGHGRNLGRVPRLVDLAATACLSTGVECPDLPGMSLLEHT
jgi:predicted AlkP superfamily phosphohydrolase/phosphomutase